MIVLGIDPGTARTGYGVVSAIGQRRCGPSTTAASRRSTTGPSAPASCSSTRRSVDLIETHRPEAVGVERLFFNRNVQTAFAVGQARGVALLVAAQHGLPVYEYGPHEVKIAVTGYGRASKEQVQRMVQLLLGMADAAAAG